MKNIVEKVPCGLKDLKTAIPLYFAQKAVLNHDKNKNVVL